MDELDDELQAFLTEHRLEAHADAFAREGYDSLQYLCVRAIGRAGGRAAWRSRGAATDWIWRTTRIRTR